MKIGVFLPNWIGDAVMATPALRALREHYADAEIVGIHRPVISTVFAGSDLLDRTMIHDPGGNMAEHRGLGFVRTLRSEAFDVVLLLTNSFRTAWMAWLGGATRRVGFTGEGRSWMLTDPVPDTASTEVVSALDCYLALAGALGCATERRPTELAVTPDEESEWQSYAATFDAELAALRTVVLNGGGAFGAAKHWPTEYFADLARRIVDQYDWKVLVLCGPAERETAREIVRQADRSRVLSLAECELSLGLSKAAVRGADLMITTDSGPRHFAQPFGVPVITLFGPTHVGLSETYDEQAIHLQVPVECGPCQQRVCPLEHHACMRDLTVDRVFRAVREQLERNRRRVA